MPSIIHLLKLAAIAGPQVGICRQVVDPSCVFQSPQERCAITNISKENFHGRGQMIHFGAGTFDHPDLLARNDQLIHEMAADETSPAGHDRQVVHEPYGTPE